MRKELPKEFEIGNFMNYQNNLMTMMNKMMMIKMMIQIVIIDLFK